MAKKPETVPPPVEGLPQPPSPQDAANARVNELIQGFANDMKAHRDAFYIRNPAAPSINDLLLDMAWVRQKLAVLQVTVEQLIGETEKLKKGK